MRGKQRISFAVLALALSTVACEHDPLDPGYTPVRPIVVQEPDPEPIDPCATLAQVLAQGAAVTDPCPPADTSRI